MSVILTLNAGSSSLKFALYRAGAEPEVLQSGQVENLGPVARLSLHGNTPHEIGPADHAVAVRAILTALEADLKGQQVEGVGHRIVHGGKAFGAPVELTKEVLAQLETLVPLACPYSNLPNLQACCSSPRRRQISLPMRHRPAVHPQYRPTKTGLRAGRMSVLVRP